MIIQKYNLNIVPDKVPVFVECSQYDKLSRTIVFTIYNEDELYTIPTGSLVTVRGTKKDKTGFEYPCTVNGSEAQFDIEEQMTIFEGQVPCELRITSSGELLGTCNFVLNVERSPLTDDTIISDTDMPLIQEASAAADRAEAAASQAVSVLSTAVKKVNNILPDSNGNVEITIPDVSNKMNKVTSPTANDILLTNSSGQAIDSGKKLADLQDKLTAGNGIDITSNTITNKFAALISGTDLNSINYEYSGYALSPTNAPVSGNGHLVSQGWNSAGTYGFQFWNKYNEAELYYRHCTNGNWSVWYKVGLTAA